MTKLIMNHIIFSFDNPWQIHTAAKVYRHLDTLWAMNKLAHEPTLGHGYYKGVLEPIVILDYNDFMDYVIPYGCVDNQESFLQLNPRSPRTTALQGTLVFQDDTESVRLGGFNTVSKSEAIQADAWSYFNEQYWVCG